MNDHEGPAPVAIVTGAGQGMGRAIALELHGRGYRLGLMSPSGRSEELAREIGAVGLRGSTTEAGDLTALVEATMTAYGRIDGVVNNTGGLAQFNREASTVTSPAGFDSEFEGVLLEVSDAQWLEGVDFYMLNVARMARLVTPVMERQGAGSIVNISSMAALEPRLHYPVSSVARLALAGYTKLYADRYGRAGIRMNSVLPGYVETRPFSGDFAAQLPIPRLITAGEIAATVAFLLSDGAASITGQNLPVDGGVNRGI